ncbi:tyrosine-protein phosphatase [Rufibacter roseus]|uniref:protein-tyrosine-phosphatase n=1 Tax=Rufibacter roseus TaxID=1567108 RepID=A0ABW2DE20_9BACT|nr:CpsB/CapC family capsule biosynthesis tyrosine phosphatase [Rufibacter roseus]
MWNSLRQLFGRKEESLSSYATLEVDMHSHLLPGLDDGAANLDDSLLLLKELQRLGFRKLCMTPHIMGDFYKNTPESIREKLHLLQAAATEHEIEVELSCAAEYYLDEWFVEKLEEGQELLTFGGERRYLLLETSYMNEPAFLQQAIFGLQAAGYTVVLAHPERYTYFYGRLDNLMALRELGVLFQLNTNSLSGYYSKTAQEVAKHLIQRKAVEFLGTDTHSMRHTRALERTLAEPLLNQALQLPLLNPTL